MKSKSNNVKLNETARKASLALVLKDNEDIKETVKKAAVDLMQVNKDLKQEKVPVKVIKKALTQNEDVEQNVAKAGEDLSVVNVKLADEMAERIVIESELADTKNDLAEIRKDLTKTRILAEEAQQSALQDALTGLPNRVSFEQGLEHGLIQAKRHFRGLAVLFIDLDKFKKINDDYGHDLGDKVLLMAANRLKESLRGEDIVCRWGGDEFACLLFEVDHESDVTHLAEKMINRIAEECVVNGTTLSIKASIGIALYPADGETADVLFKNADKAMYKAKRTRKRVMLFRKTRERLTG